MSSSSATPTPESQAEVRPRMVQVLTKCNKDPDTGAKTLAVGQTFRFKSGDGYTVMPDGSVRAANGAQAKGKAYRKKLKKIRRALREQEVQS